MSSKLYVEETIPSNELVEQLLAGIDSAIGSRGYPLLTVSCPKHSEEMLIEFTGTLAALKLDEQFTFEYRRIPGDLKDEELKHIGADFYRVCGCKHAKACIWWATRIGNPIPGSKEGYWGQPESS